MPTQRRLCPKPGCTNTTPCPRHKQARPNPAQRGYGNRHRTTFRQGVLARDPYCVLCGKPATDADHWPLSRKQLAAQGKDPDDPRYGRGLCHPCHSRETTRNQPGGYIAPH
jgi:5-methylcytosine-specific restriction protein A